MRPQTSRQALRHRRYPNFSKRNAPSFIFSSNEPVPPNASRHPWAATSIETTPPTDTASFLSEGISRMRSKPITTRGSKTKRSLRNTKTRRRSRVIYVARMYYTLAPAPWIARRAMLAGLQGKLRQVRGIFPTPRCLPSSHCTAVHKYSLC